MSRARSDGRYPLTQAGSVVRRVGVGVYVVAGGAQLQHRPGAPAVDRASDRPCSALVTSSDQRSPLLRKPAAFARLAGTAAQRCCAPTNMVPAAGGCKPRLGQSEQRFDRFLVKASEGDVPMRLLLPALAEGGVANISSHWTQVRLESVVATDYNAGAVRRPIRLRWSVLRQ